MILATNNASSSAQAVGSKIISIRRPVGEVIQPVGNPVSKWVKQIQSSSNEGAEESFAIAYFHGGFSTSEIVVPFVMMRVAQQSLALASGEFYRFCRLKDSLYSVTQ